MKIAITGASGHVGSNLYPELIRMGYDVKLMVHQDNHEIDHPNIFKADITQKDEVDSFVEGADIVIHLAARISISGDPDGSVHEVNYTGTSNVVSSCIRHNIKRLVHFSTIHVFDPLPLDQSLDESRALIGNPATAYDQSKIKGEKLVLVAAADGLNAVIIAPTSIFGPNDHFPSLLGQAIIDIYKGKIPALVPGGYDFVDVRDIVKGTINAMKLGVCGEKYILSGTFLTIKELAEKIGMIGDVTTTQRVLPIWLLKALIPIFNIQSKLTNKPPLLTNESLDALVESNPYISCEKAKSELGYSVSPVDASITDTLAWFGENGFLSK